MYSELYFQKQSRVPSFLFALAFVAIAGVVGFYFLSNTSTPTRASKKTVRQQEVANLSARQLSIFWESEVPDNGWIIYGEQADELSQIALDDRDTSEKKAQKQFHFATLKNLQPDTQYYYKIVSNNELISASGDEPFQIRTTRVTLPGSSTKPAYGKAIQTNGSPAQGAIVLIRYKDAYPLATLTGATGEWLMPLQSLISKKDNQPSIILDKDTITIQIIDDGIKTSINALISKTSPLPQTTILGKDYEFLDESQVLPAFNQREPAPNTGLQYEVSIQFPKDGAVIPGSQPLIRGTGIPGKEVIVNLNSTPTFSAKVTVDEKGDWRVNIPGNVLAGKYTLSMITEDATGKKIGDKREFSLAKSGEQVLGDATGSATLTPTRPVTPTKAPTIAPTSIISPTKTATISPALVTPTATSSASISATLVPTFPPTATPTSAYYQPATPPPPVSGVGIVPYIMAGLGMVIAGAGLILLF